MNRYTKHKNQHNCPYKFWNHSSRQTTDCQSAVYFLATVHCRSDATQNADRRDQQQRNNCQLSRLAGCRGQNLCDRHFILQRCAEIASQYSAHPAAVLHYKRLIKTFFFIPNLERFRRRISAKSLFGDVTRHDRGHQKYDQRNYYQRQDRKPDSLDDESQHRTLKFSNDTFNPLDLNKNKKRPT